MADLFSQLPGEGDTIEFAVISALVRLSLAHLARHTASASLSPAWSDAQVSVRSHHWRELSQTGQKVAAQLLIPRVQQSHDDRRAVLDCIRLIEANPAERPSAGEIARQLDFSRSRLTRLVRRETGLRFVELIHRARVRAAVAMLLKTDSQIKAIAYRVGYRRPSQLDKYFRRFIGRTPSDYKRYGGMVPPWPVIEQEAS